MMKKQNKKRGFTIIELVIVVTVIAILSAVLIPTFAGIIKKSRLTADETAARNMNTVLATVEIEEDDFGTVVNTLSENGFNSMKALIPTSKNHVFYWYSTYNTVILVDGEDNVVFPNDESIIASYATDKGTKALYDLGNVASSASDLKKAIADGGEVYLMSDVKLTGLVAITEPAETTIYLNGFDIVREKGDGIYVNNANAVVNIYGADETVEVSSCAVWAEQGTVNIYGGNFTGSHAVYSTGGTVNIYGGKFTATGETTNNADTQHAPVNMRDAARGTGIINIYGGEFYNAAGEYDLSAQIALGEVVDHRNN